MITKQPNFSKKVALTFDTFLRNNHNGKVDTREIKNFIALYFPDENAASTAKLIFEILRLPKNKEIPIKRFSIAIENYYNRHGSMASSFYVHKFLVKAAEVNPVWASSLPLQTKTKGPDKPGSLVQKRPKIPLIVKKAIVTSKKNKPVIRPQYFEHPPAPLKVKIPLTKQLMAQKNSIISPPILPPFSSINTPQNSKWIGTSPLLNILPESQIPETLAQFFIIALRLYNFDPKHTAIPHSNLSSAFQGFGATATDADRLATKLIQNQPRTDETKNIPIHIKLSDLKGSMAKYIRKIGYQKLQNSTYGQTIQHAIVIGQQQTFNNLSIPGFTLPEMTYKQVSLGSLANYISLNSLANPYFKLDIGGNTPTGFSKLDDWDNTLINKFQTNTQPFSLRTGLQKQIGDENQSLSRLLFQLLGLEKEEVPLSEFREAFVQFSRNYWKAYQEQALSDDLFGHSIVSRLLQNIYNDQLLQDYNFSDIY
jgi:hypothetical protein